MIFKFKIQSSKFKITDQNSKLLKTFNFLLVFLTFNFLLFTFPVQTSLALESSPSSNLSTELKSKLDNLKKEIASKAAKLKTEMNRKLQNKAYVGVLKSKTETSLTLASKTGAKIITVNQDTIFESNIKSKQKFSLNTLSEENYIVALGDVDETQVLIAKKIILLPTSEDAKAFFWGQIISISNKLITVQEKNQKKISVNSADATIKKAGVIAFADDLNLRDFVILTGSLDENGILQAEFIYIIPSGGIIRSKKVATSSAKISSPSAAPTQKKKPS